MMQKHTITATSLYLYLQCETLQTPDLRIMCTHFNQHTSTHTLADQFIPAWVKRLIILLKSDLPVRGKKTLQLNCVGRGQIKIKIMPTADSAQQFIRLDGQHPESYFCQENKAKSPIQAFKAFTFCLSAEGVSLYFLHYFYYIVHFILAETGLLRQLCDTVEFGAGDSWSIESWFLLLAQQESEKENTFSLQLNGEKLLCERASNITDSQRLRWITFHGHLTLPIVNPLPLTK